MESTDEVRFKFGRNWTSFLSLLDESRIQEAESSLKRALNLGIITLKTIGGCLPITI